MRASGADLQGYERAEHALLLGSARLHASPEQASRLARLFACDLDWSLLLELATAHGLRPLLFRHAVAHAAQALPAGVETRLWVHQQQLLSKNRQLAAELSAILEMFGSNAVPALPFKGPMLALELYGDLGLREFGDLDLLVPASKLRQATGLLATRGYAPMFALSPAGESAMLDSPAQYHWMLMRGQGQGLVELHWQTDAEYPVGRPSEEAWWSGLQRTGFDGRDVPRLAAQEMLLALCLHGSKHHWTSLHWLADVAELIRQSPALDWRWLLDRADATKSGTRVALALLLANADLDAPLPQSVHGWLDGFPRARALCGAIRAGWFRLPPRSSGPFERLRLNMKLYDSGAHRLRHLVDETCRPGIAEWSRWQLPASLFFIYVPLRMLRLLGKQGARLIGVG